MKNILVILVGGTICTTVNEKGTLSVSDKAGIQLKYNFENSNSLYAKEAAFDLTENLYILSENMTVDKWNKMIDIYREKTNAKRYDGVIFAHGTDTLAYSTAMFSMLLADTDIPVFFVSSNQRLESAKSNGDANFRYAVECICREIAPNVYVTYKNISDEQMYLHLGSRLEQCKNYSEDFYSVGALNITDISEHNYKEYFKILQDRFPSADRKPKVDTKAKLRLSNCVLNIQPYVGLNYDVYDYTKFLAILHGTYHSGTVCVQKSREESEYGDGSILHMIDVCSDKKLNVDIYVSPSKLEGEVYETVPAVKHHSEDENRVHFLYGTTNEAAYAKLVLAYSLYENQYEIESFMENQINFEFIYE